MLLRLGMLSAPPLVLWSMVGFRHRQTRQNACGGLMQKEKVTRVKLADGTVKEYRYPRDKQNIDKRSKTVSDAIEKYYSKSDYKKLRPNTVKSYDRAIRIIKNHFGNVDLAKITYDTVESHRDVFYDTPGIANHVHKMWGILLKVAHKAGWIPYHPARGITKLKTGEWKRWPQEAIDYANAHLGEPLRRAMVLALYTGQREGDCCAMQWTDYKDGLISVTQEKTGEKVWVPAHYELVAKLDRWRSDGRSSTFILTTSRGLPWKVKSFSTRFCTELHKRDKETGEYAHPLLADLVFHGLRKSAAANLAEAGCDVLEISAITGHTDLKTLGLYVREARRKIMAKTAMGKLEKLSRDKN